MIDDMISKLSILAQELSTATDELNADIELVNDKLRSTGLAMSVPVLQRIEVDGIRYGIGCKSIEGKLQLTYCSDGVHSASLTSASRSVRAAALNHIEAILESLATHTKCLIGEITGN